MQITPRTRTAVVGLDLSLSLEEARSLVYAIWLMHQYLNSLHLPLTDQSYCAVELRHALLEAMSESRP